MDPRQHAVYQQQAYQQQFQQLYHQPQQPQTPRPVAPTLGPLQPHHCQLVVRQQPLEALVTTGGKEKARKPVDPPPIVELIVSPRAESSRVYLNSPYLFVCAQLCSEKSTESHDNNGADSLAGTLVSSLHRLRDESNHEVGYFVFPDMSVKIVGRFRLNFSLFEFIPGDGVVQCLQSCLSNPFEVVPSKTFRGLQESTYLSRNLSDQGIRLRLRKEGRALSNKRPYPEDSPPNDEAQAPDKRVKMPLRQHHDVIPTFPAAQNFGLYNDPGFMGYQPQYDYNMPFPHQ
jgi:hypothetical protein